MDNRNKKSNKRKIIFGIGIIVLVLIFAGMVLELKCANTVVKLDSSSDTNYRERILDELMISDIKISHISNIIVDKGDNTIIPVFIRNKKTTQLNYRINFTIYHYSDNKPLEIKNATWFKLNFKQVYTLKPNESETKNISLGVPTNVMFGAYVGIFSIIDNDANEIYASRDFNLAIIKEKNSIQKLCNFLNKILKK